MHALILGGELISAGRCWLRDDLGKGDEGFWMEAGEFGLLVHDVPRVVHEGMEGCG